MKNNFSKSEFELVVNVLKNIANVRLNKNGNITIENPIKSYQENWLYRKPTAVHYVIGKNYNGYWIRRTTFLTENNKTVSSFPLHYDRKNHTYEFETFVETLSYFINLLFNYKLDF